MFEFIRSHQRLMQFLLLLLIVPSFAFFGLESYTRSRNTSDDVAKVGKVTISQVEYDNALRSQMDRMQQMFGDKFDAKMFDTPEARKSILDNLIAQKAIAQEAQSRHLTVTPELVRDTVLQALPSLADASLSKDERMDRYKQMVSAQGETIEGFEARVAQSMAAQQLTQTVQVSGFVPTSVVDRLIKISQEQREVQELNFKPADYTSQVKLTDAMIKEYYDKNIKDFEIPESVNAEYAVLTLDDVASQISLNPADVQAYYDNNKTRYGSLEERKASHILINASKDAKEADKATAKAKADKLLAEVRANPASFAAVAKANSQDPGSAPNGGDLGFFGKGAMVKPFEEAAFALKEGAISDVVQSDFGYHIILLTGVKAAAIKPFDAVKTEIETEVKKQQAQKEFNKAAETFTSTVYEQADSLKPAADKLKLKIVTVGNLGRNQISSSDPAKPANSPLNNAKFLGELFSEDSLKTKRNTKAIETAANTLIAGRVLNYQAAKTKPMIEVQDQVRARLIQREAAVLASKAGEDKLATLIKTSSDAGFAAAKMVSRGNPAGLQSDAISAVMKGQAALPAYVGAKTTEGGYAVYKINKITPVELTDAKQKENLAKQLSDQATQEESRAQVEWIKAKSNVQVLKDAKDLNKATDPNAAPNPSSPTNAPNSQRPSAPLGRG